MRCIDITFEIDFGFPTLSNLRVGGLRSSCSCSFDDSHYEARLGKNTSTVPLEQEIDQFNLCAPKRKQAYSGPDLMLWNS